MLAYGDLPFNAGLWRPISIDNGPSGTLVNATPPAAVSSGHGEAGLRSFKALKFAMCQALSLSPDPVMRARVGGVANDGAPSCGLAGTSQHGTPTIIYYPDTMVAMAGGAQSFMDGQVCYGGSMMAGCSMPDVETHEAMDPILFLWRRMAPNSAGAGIWRGGEGIDQAFAVLYTDQLSGFAMSITAEVPSRGIGGGYPPAANAVRPIFGSNVEDLLERGIQPLPSRIDGAEPPFKNKVGHFILRRGDVLRFLTGGGGGLGDPLLREADRVARDVRDGFVTVSNARDLYGVIAPDGHLDEPATEMQREAIRHGRIGKVPSRKLDHPNDPGVSVTAEGDGEAVSWTCAYCGSIFCDVSMNWRDHAVRQQSRVTDRFKELEILPVYDRKEAPDVVVVEYFCSECAGSLIVDVVVEGTQVPAPILRSRRAS
jgi:N-methylhydantoinase B